MNWETTYDVDIPQFDYNTFITMNPLPDPPAYDERSEPAFYYGEITTPPGRANFYEPSTPPESTPTIHRRPSGNNPYGSRGCASCISCRKRKGKCSYKNHNDVCDFCAKYGHPCGPKVTKTEFAQLISGKPCPPLRYSTVVAELEREFPQALPGDIHEMAGSRLKEIMEKRDRVMNGGSKNSSPLSDGTASPPSRQKKRRRQRLSS